MVDTAFLRVPPPADPAEFAKASVSGKSLSVGSNVVG